MMDFGRYNVIVSIFSSFVFVLCSIDSGYPLVWNFVINLSNSIFFVCVNKHVGLIQRPYEYGKGLSKFLEWV